MGVDPGQLISSLVVISLWLVLPFVLVGRSRIREALQAAGSRAIHRFQPAEPAPDPLLAELAADRRNQRRLADLDRLRELVEHDTHQSATRQRANRMAYDRVRAEFAADPVPVRVPARVPVAAGPVRRPSRHDWGTASRAMITPPSARPTVEHLDVDWRS